MIRKAGLEERQEDSQKRPTGESIQSSGVPQDRGQYRGLQDCLAGHRKACVRILAVRSRLANMRKCWA